MDVGIMIGIIGGLGGVVSVFTVFAMLTRGVVTKKDLEHHEKHTLDLKYPTKSKMRECVHEHTLSPEQVREIARSELPETGKLWEAVDDIRESIHKIELYLARIKAFEETRHSGFQSPQPRKTIISGGETV